MNCDQFLSALENVLGFDMWWRRHDGRPGKLSQCKYCTLGKPLETLLVCPRDKIGMMTPPWCLMKCVIHLFREFCPQILADASSRLIGGIPVRQRAVILQGQRPYLRVPWNTYHWKVHPVLMCSPSRGLDRWLRCDVEFQILDSGRRHCRLLRGDEPLTLKSYYHYNGQESWHFDINEAALSIDWIIHLANTWLIRLTETGRASNPICSCIGRVHVHDDLGHIYSTVPV